MTAADRRILASQASEQIKRWMGIYPEAAQARRLGPRPANAGDAPKVLLVTPRDWAIHVAWDGLVARALEARGARAFFARCGGGLPICDRNNVHEAPPMPCRSCDRHVRTVLAAFGFDARPLVTQAVSGWPELDELTFEELEHIEYRGIRLGAEIGIALRWFLCNSDLRREPLAAPTMRAFLRSARAVTDGMVREVERVGPDVVVALNGTFLFEAVARRVAIDRGIRFVSYERAHMEDLVVADASDQACYYRIDRLWNAIRDEPLDVQESAILDQYLDDRVLGLRTPFQIWTNPEFRDLDRPAKRRVVVLPNVTWDSAVLGLETVFDNMADWLTTTIGSLLDADDVEVIVRVHPGETSLSKWSSREPAAAVIAEHFGELPAHIRVIPPDDPTSTYPIIESSDVGVVYTSTIGLELATRGKPVLVGANPHYANKGFTHSTASKDEFVSALAAMIDDPERFRPDRELARRYAYHFFFSAPMPQPPAIEPVPGLARLASDASKLLGPGEHAGLDRLCGLILDGHELRA